MEIKTHSNGEKYFSALPDICKTANLSDFYNDEEKLILNKPFLVRSNYKHIFYAKRVNLSFPYPNSDFSLFLQQGDIFIFNF